MKSSGEKRVAAIIYFRSESNLEDVQKVITKLSKQLDNNDSGPQINSAIVREYDPEWGHPVWYVP